MTDQNPRLHHLRKIRREELNKIIPLLSPNCSVLEIGGGAGWQAKMLSEQGYDVTVIEIAEGSYSESRVWDAQVYDGCHIPFQNACFDIVLSSNVLEHIPHVKEYQLEIMRVLKPNGTVIHVLPTPSWRFWAIVSHYPIFLENVLKVLWTRTMDSKVGTQSDTTLPIIDSSTRNSRGLLSILMRMLFPGRHGAIGNSITELYLYSRIRWCRLFRRTGWKLLDVFPVRLFYTPFLMRHALPGLRTARFLSYLLGNSCLVYVMRPDKTNR